MCKEGEIRSRDACVSVLLDTASLPGLPGLRVSLPLRPHDDISCSGRCDPRTSGTCSPLGRARCLAIPIRPQEGLSPVVVGFPADHDNTLCLLLRGLCNGSGEAGQMRDEKLDGHPQCGVIKEQNFHDNELSWKKRKSKRAINERRNNLERKLSQEGARAN